MTVWTVVSDASAYEISRCGRVRRIRDRKEIKPYRMSHRYVGVNLQKSDGRRTVFTMHRLLAKAFVKGYAPGLDAAHKDGVRDNNRLDNLKWASRKENEADKRVHGTAVRGERHPASVLKDDIVRNIKRSYRGGYGDLTRLSRVFDVPLPTISNIIHGYTWRHVHAD